MTRPRPRPIASFSPAPKAPPPRSSARPVARLSKDKTAETSLPEALLPPEALVDVARGRGPATTTLPIGAMLDDSPEAVDELEHIASFEDERDARRRSRAHAARLEVAIEGALATLDEEPEAGRGRPRR